MRPNWDGEPAYPGAAIANIDLVKDGELGCVRIQHYGAKVRVGSFLPGDTECPPGDTPKTFPERSIWVHIENRVGAETFFDQYVKDARDEGWVEYVR
jgi:hypothetical protein